MSSLNKKVAGLVILAVVAVGAPVYASAATTAASSPLGTPHKATGKPIVFGILNLQSGPVTFPEVLGATQAAVAYVNNYQDGLGGRPIKLISCATDGQPATSARCANQILDKHPVAILGGADTGAPASIPVWQRKNLAYIGGVPFTPAESNYKNAIQFMSVSIADNAAASVYAGQTLKIKSASVIYSDDPQGKSIGVGVIPPVMKAAGITKVTTVPLADTAADPSAAVASALSTNPQLVYVNTPAACAAVLKSLQSLGFKGKLMGIEPCVSPPALAAAGSAANGIIYATPYVPLSQGGADAKLFLAAMKKYGPKVPIDSLATAGFATVMNLVRADGKIKGNLTTAKILAPFKTGSNHPNFLAHPYTCNGKQLAGNTAVCNAYQRLRTVKNGNIVPLTSAWVTSGRFFKGERG
jgi:branched-chain amino acid transport system substrate-binding protein